MITIEEIPAQTFKECVELTIQEHFNDPQAKVISIHYEPEKNAPFDAGGTMMQSIAADVCINGKQGAILIGWNADEATIFAFVPGKDENGKGIDYKTPL